VTLSRIVTLNQDDPNLHTILQTVPVDNGPVELRDPDFFEDINIKDAYILRAKGLQIDIKKKYSVQDGQKANMRLKR